MLFAKFSVQRLVLPILIVLGTTTIAILWFLAGLRGERDVERASRPVKAQETELTDDKAWKRTGAEIVRRAIPLDRLFLSLGENEKVVGHPQSWSVDQQEWSDWDLQLATRSGIYVTFLRSSMRHISASWRVLLDEQRRGMNVGRIYSESGADPSIEVCRRVVGHEPTNNVYAGASGMICYRTVEIEFTIRKTVDIEQMTLITEWADVVADCLLNNYVIVGGR